MEAHGFSLREHGFYIINFAVLLYLLVRYGRSPLKKALNDRADRIEKRMVEAGRQMDAAAKELETAQARAASLERDRAEMAARLQEEARRLSDSIAQRAEREQEKIRKSGQQALENEKLRIEKAVQSEIAAAALAKAEEKLKTQWRSLNQPELAREFVAGLEKAAAPEGK